MQGPAEARMIWEHRCTPTRLGLAFRSTLDEYPEGKALAIIYLSLLPTTQLAACSEFPRRPPLGLSVNEGSRGPSARSLVGLSIANSVLLLSCTPNCGHRFCST